MNPSQPPAPSNPHDDSAASHPPPSFNVFLDSQGLRPIWGIALFLLFWQLLSQFVPSLFAAIFPFPHSQPLIAARSLYIFESAAFLCVGIATILMGKLEGHVIAIYGFKPLHGPRNLLLGAATGAILLSALVAILRGSGLLIFDARLLFSRRVFSAAVVWAGGFLLVALTEELLLRGYLQFTLTRALHPLLRRIVAPSQIERASFWTAAIALSIAFGGIHTGNSGESPLGLIDAALIGLVFCLSLWRTGSLWWAIGFHAAWDWAQSFLYGVADSGLMMQNRLFATHPTGRTILSGGLTGPEGSLFLLPIALTACAVIFLTLPPNHSASEQVVTPAAALDLP